MTEHPKLQAMGADGPLPRLVRAIEAPSEVDAEIQRYCLKLGLVTMRDKTHVAEEIKLQYFFGGKDVAFLPTSNGRLIIAIGSMRSEEFMQALDSLKPDERRQVIISSVSPWNDQSSQILV